MEANYVLNSKYVKIAAVNQFTLVIGIPIPKPIVGVVVIEADNDVKFLMQPFVLNLQYCLVTAIASTKKTAEYNARSHAA
jgi:hypothetical protein